MHFRPLEMVAEALKNPWVATGRTLRFGEADWDGNDPASEWNEHELVPGESPVFRRLFAGKEGAGPKLDGEEEYLYVEDVTLASPRYGAVVPRDGMPALQPDKEKVRLQF